MAGPTYNLQDIVAAEALKIISNDMTFIKKINRVYEEKLQTPVEDHRLGTSIRIPKPARRSPTLRSGWVMNIAPVVEDVTTLTIDTPAGDDTAFSDADLALLLPDPNKNVESWGRRFIKPRVSNIANQVEADLFSRAVVLVNNLVGTAGTVPQTSDTIAAAKQKLDENLAPQDDRAFIMSAAASHGLSEALKGTFVREVSEAALVKGFISDLYGMENFMSEVTPFHKTGTFGSNSPTTNTTTVQTGTAISTAGWTGSTQVLTKGDIITFAGVFAVNYVTKATLSNLQQFVVTANVTSDSTGNATTVNIFPGIVTSGSTQTVSGAPATSATITIVGSSATNYRQNLLFHKDAFTCAFSKMFMPKAGVEMASQKSADGITIRYLRGMDLINSRLLDRIDVYYGFAGLYPQWGCRVTE
jgi:hypothetical protein